MTKQMKAEIIWDAFCSITDGDNPSCLAIDSAYISYRMFSKLRRSYSKLFRASENYNIDSAWLAGQFAIKEKHNWRMNALLLFREMILTGDV